MLLTIIIQKIIIRPITYDFDNYSARLCVCFVQFILMLSFLVTICHL